ncbi:MAG: hypothetical protein WB496_02955, partial [Pseudolabrys sp.]
VRVIPAHASGQHLPGYATVIGNKAAPPARRQLVGLLSARESGMAKLIKARKKSASAKKTYIEPITCPHCGGQAYLMRRTPHPEIKGEVWTFECKDCGKQTEKSKLN